MFFFFHPAFKQSMFFLYYGNQFHQFPLSSYNLWLNFLQSDCTLVGCLLFYSLKLVLEVLPELHVFTDNTENMIQVIIIQKKGGKTEKLKNISVNVNALLTMRCNYFNL